MRLPIYIFSALLLSLCCQPAAAQTGTQKPTTLSQSDVASIRKAAEQGNADAETNLGVIYDNGHGLPQNYSQAVFWWNKAADQGAADAQYLLGTMYYLGRGVPPDAAKAYFWFDLAAAGEVDGLNPEEIAKDRDGAASRLTPAELSKMQERARKWFAASTPDTRAAQEAANDAADAEAAKKQEFAKKQADSYPRKKRWLTILGTVLGGTPGADSSPAPAGWQPRQWSSAPPTANSTMTTILPLGNGLYSTQTTGGMGNTQFGTTEVLPAPGISLQHLNVPMPFTYTPSPPAYLHPYVNPSHLMF